MEVELREFDGYSEDEPIRLMVGQVLTPAAVPRMRSGFPQVDLQVHAEVKIPVATFEVSLFFLAFYAYINTRQ